MGSVLSLHRGYSPIESLFYDSLIAPGTLVAARPILDDVATQTPPDGSVLDVGCGGGQAVMTLSDLRPDLHLLGLDPSGTLVRRATGRVHDRQHVTFVQGSAVALPLQSDQFDVVYSLFAIKHWPAQRQGLVECVRVTKPGGRLIIAELDGSADRSRWRSLVALTRMPELLLGNLAAPALSPIVRRLVQADDLRRDLAQLPVVGVRLISDPNLAVIRLDAVASK